MGNRGLHLECAVRKITLKRNENKQMFARNAFLRHEVDRMTPRGDTAV